MPQTPFCTCRHVPAQIMTCTEKKKRFHRADECIQPARHSTQQCTAQSNSFMFMVPLWPKYFIFVVVAINQIIKSKTGFIGASKTKAWLLYKVDFSACGCKMQAKQDYSTAVLHMVSWLQECTVQRLFRIECNTTFWEKKWTNKNNNNKKKKNHFFISLGIWKRPKLTLFPLPVLPGEEAFLSIKSTLQRYNWRPVPGFMSFWLSKMASIVPLEWR